LPQKPCVHFSSPSHCCLLLLSPVLSLCTTCAHTFPYASTCTHTSICKHMHIHPYASACARAHTHTHTWYNMPVGITVEKAPIEQPFFFNPHTPFAGTVSSSPYTPH
jgi:hypothetical protein